MHTQTCIYGCALSVELNVYIPLGILKRDSQLYAQFLCYVLYFRIGCIKRFKNSSTFPSSSESLVKEKKIHGMFLHILCCCCRIQEPKSRILYQCLNLDTTIYIYDYEYFNSNLLLKQH